MADEEVQILWDPITKTVLVIKGDEMASVPGVFESQGQAMEAGLALCRKLGWIAVDREE